MRAGPEAGLPASGILATAAWCPVRVRPTSRWRRWRLAISLATQAAACASEVSRVGP